MVALRAQVLTLGTALLLAGGAAGCNGVADQGKLPPDVQDPGTLQTPAGAMERYRGAVRRLRLTFESALLDGAVLTDELASLPAPIGQAGQLTLLDSRQQLEQYAEPIYDSLHMVRAQAREARGFLGAYAPDSSPALRAHLYAIEGYAEIFLADLFCSGIPLSTVDFNADYTFASGSTTDEVYTHAAALFDSALALASASAAFQHLAAVGRGRALVAIGHYADAAAAVAAVPDDYAYRVQVPQLSVFDGTTHRLINLTSYWDYSSSQVGVPGMGDHEGGNGLDYRSSGDPRTKAVFHGNGLYGGEMYYPDTSRFATSGTVIYTMASGVEARLIEAEAALQAGSDAWLTALNALRTDGAYDTQPNAIDPSKTDTLWHAGTGGVQGLAPLADPGSTTARADLMFRERAFWLYLTGHRQGDLRRLSRQYLRTPELLYPSGTYPGGSGSYGTEVTMPVPSSERELNSKYSGCFHRNP